MRTRQCPRCKLSAVCLHRSADDIARDYWLCGECAGYFRRSDPWGKGKGLAQKGVCNDFARSVVVRNYVDCCSRCKIEVEHEKKMQKERELGYRA